MKRNMIKNEKVETIDEQITQALPVFKGRYMALAAARKVQADVFETYLQALQRGEKIVQDWKWIK